jgi:hypothetical protein
VDDAPWPRSGAPRLGQARGLGTWNVTVVRRSPTCWLVGRWKGRTAVVALQRRVAIAVPLYNWERCHVYGTLGNHCHDHLCHGVDHAATFDWTRRKLEGMNMKDVDVDGNVADWIVMQGTLINTVQGGGFEFFGPYTEQEAIKAENTLNATAKQCKADVVATKLQLLRGRTLVR